MVIYLKLAERAIEIRTAEDIVKGAYAEKS